MWVTVPSISSARQTRTDWRRRPLTDQQIAAELGLSLNTLKSTWRSIYDRVASHAPYVLSGMDGSGEDGGVRGTEKRRGVLSFVESHPQELRPYLKTA